MSTFVMVRTICCESYKMRGARCAICPNRIENREAVRAYRREASQVSFGCRVDAPAPKNCAADFAAS